jgi:hypothetical protein
LNHLYRLLKSRYERLQAQLSGCRCGQRRHCYRTEMLHGHCIISQVLVREQSMAWGYCLSVGQTTSSSGVAKQLQALHSGNSQQFLI